MNSFRYLGLKSLSEVDDMTLKEYGLRMKAYGLSRIDKERDLHLQAYLSLIVQETEQRGKKRVPVYPTFNSFYDYEEQLNKAKRESGKDKKGRQASKFRNIMLAMNMRGGTHE